MELTRAAVMQKILVLLCFRSLKQDDMESRNLFNSYLLRTDYIPGTVLSYGNTAVNKADAFPALMDHKQWIFNQPAFPFLQNNKEESRQWNKGQNCFLTGSTVF